MSDPTTPPEEPVVPAAAPVEPAATPVEPTAAPVAPPVADPYAQPTAYAQPAAYQPPAYQQPAYGQQPYAVAPKTNTLAIVTLVLALIGVSIGAVITGHISLNQIKKTNEGGRTLALVGLIIGYVGSLAWIGIWIFWIFLFVVGASSYSSYGY